MQSIAVLEQRNQCPVAARENADATDLAQPIGRCFVGQSNCLIRSGQQLGGCTELATQAVHKDLELQLPDGGEHVLDVAHVGVAKHLHNTFLIELLEALAELLRLGVVERTSASEHLRREARQRWILDCRTSTPGLKQRVADVDAAGVDQPDDIAGECVFDRLAIRPEGGRRVLGGHVAPGARIGDRHAALEVA